MENIYLNVPENSVKGNIQSIPPTNKQSHYRSRTTRIMDDTLQFCSLNFKEE